MYKCEILADSVSPQRHRLTTFKVTYPRIIHAEMLRHRMFSRNVASSRAIPFKKMVKDVEENPFIPIAWQKDHKGMQGTEYLTDDLSIQFAKSNWLTARDWAIKSAHSLNSTNNGYEAVTKQLCNRLLEPFVWCTELITTTELDNFFDLRCPQYSISSLIDGDNRTFKSKKDFLSQLDYDPIFPETDLEWLSINKSQADIHIQAIAELMWDAYNESTPKELKAGEWHIPYGDKIDPVKIAGLDLYVDEFEATLIKIATARCARISYETLGDNPKIDYEADIKLHDRLIQSKHWSPFEHCARAMTDQEHYQFRKGWLDNISQEVIESSAGWCNNFRGFIQYRYLIEGNNS